MPPERVKPILKRAVFNLELGLVLRNGQIKKCRECHTAGKDNLVKISGF
jgi:hypothetical protein